MNPPAAPHLPGEPGVWILILGDLAVFSLFFATILVVRGQAAAPFHAAQAQLNQGFGLANTLLMLTSSWFVAAAVHLARRGTGRLAAAAFGAGLSCGAAFGAVKLAEWSEKLEAGITPHSNDFFMYYFVFTGIHFLHVLVGMAVLAFLARSAARGGLDVRRLGHLESGACFWHVVDLLWIVLFALFYLVR